MRSHASASMARTESSKKRALHVQPLFRVGSTGSQLKPGSDVLEAVPRSPTTSQQSNDTSTPTSSSVPSTCRQVSPTKMFREASAPLAGHVPEYGRTSENHSEGGGASSARRSTPRLDTYRRMLFANKSGSRKGVTEAAKVFANPSYVETDIHGRGYCSMLLDEHEIFSDF